MCRERSHATRICVSPLSPHLLDLHLDLSRMQLVGYWWQCETWAPPAYAIGYRDLCLPRTTLETLGGHQQLWYCNFSEFLRDGLVIGVFLHVLFFSISVWYVVSCMPTVSQVETVMFL